MTDSEFNFRSRKEISEIMNLEVGSINVNRYNGVFELAFACNLSRLSEVARHGLYFNKRIMQLSVKLVVLILQSFVLDKVCLELS